MTDARRMAAEALRQARQWLIDWAPGEAYEPGENHTALMATQEWIDKALAAIEVELAHVPEERERLAAHLTELADGKTEWGENHTEIKALRDAAAALRSPVS